MEQYIPKSALVAEIEKRRNDYINSLMTEQVYTLNDILDFIDTLEVKEVDLEKEYEEFVVDDSIFGHFITNDTMGMELARHFFELGLKAQHDNWKVVDNINPPQADKNKIYCVFTKGRYILAKVIEHPKDEETLQWKCTEFPHHRYDMCEGDKYMLIN